MDSIVNAAIQHGKLEEKLFNEFYSERLKIVVLGTGGGGNNTVNRLCHIGIEGAELIAANTDRQDLQKIDNSLTKILMGAKLMRGLGAGGFPELGQKAAEASRHELGDLLSGTNLIFICAGMGGGTGTGSSPVIADIAKEQGAITVGIVTFPFELEKTRLGIARKGIDNLRKVCDTVIVIDNNKLVQYVPNLPIDKAFSVADEVVARAVKGITETIMEPSLINLDFADIKAIMSRGEVAVISVGDGEGPDKVEKAAEKTLKQPLLDVSYKDGSGALIHVTGGEDLTLGQANSVGKLITDKLSSSAKVTWGARVTPRLHDKIEVISIITGVKSPHIFSSGEREAGSYVYTKEYDNWSREIGEI